MASTEASGTSSHPFTCNTCLVAFKSSDLQRGHMQSDWHRYNLKRRVVSLPPLSSEIFTEKVLANQATAAATAAKAQFEKLCPACNKTYFSENAFRNHVQSQKHKQKVASMQNGVEDSDAGKEDETNSMVSSAFSLGEPADTKSTVTEDSLAEQEFSEVVDGIKKTSLRDGSPLRRRPSRPHHSSFQDKPAHPLSPTDDEIEEDDTEAEDVKDDPAAAQKCLFCNTLSADLSVNVAHMRSKHGLFIPEQSYLVDLKGLMLWLQDRVSVLHECLYCGITKHTRSGIQTHMRDKGHCMIAFESEEEMIEVGQFYDFSSTYSDDESESDEEMEDAVRKPRLGADRKAQTVGIEGDADMVDGDDEDWEDEGSNSDDTEDGGAALNGEAKPKRRKPKIAPVQSIYHDEEGLHLPSGRLAGHRSLARYFRQNLHSYPTPEERQARRAIADAAAERDEDAMDTDSQATETNTALTPTGPRGRPENAVVSRANGGLGMLGISQAKRDEVTKKEKSDRRRAQRQQNRYQAGNEKRANHQAHFRDPLLQ